MKNDDKYFIEVKVSEQMGGQDFEGLLKMSTQEIDLTALANLFINIANLTGFNYIKKITIDTEFNSVSAGFGSDE